MKILRKVEFRIPLNRGESNDTDFLMADPTSEEVDEQLVESKLLEIDELANGDTFADHESILKEPITYSVLT